MTCMDAYTTTDGDVLDAIVLAHYGDRADALGDVLAAVLDANPGLADQGAVLPAGVAIKLPELPTPASIPTVRLWD